MYKSVPDGFDFDSEFPTYIIAFCPDTDSWFVTNKRFFYYEYPVEFEDENSGISYFKEHAEIFVKLEEDMKIERYSEYRCGVWLYNTNEFIKSEEQNDN